MSLFSISYAAKKDYTIYTLPSKEFPPIRHTAYPYNLVLLLHQIFFLSHDVLFAVSGVASEQTFSQAVAFLRITKDENWNSLNALV